jgi:hypothetical protein
VLNFHFYALNGVSRCCGLKLSIRCRSYEAVGINLRIEKSLVRYGLNERGVGWAADVTILPGFIGRLAKMFSTRLQPVEAVKGRQPTCHGQNQHRDQKYR